MPNDECVGATPITANQTFFDTTYATNEQTSSTSQPYRDQWFFWNATCSGLLKVLSRHPASIQVFPTCASTTTLIEIPYGGSGSTTVVMGTLLIFRAGINSHYAPLGLYDFNITCTAPLVNDKMEGAIPWPSPLGTFFNYSTEFATNNDGDPTMSCGYDIWYTWVATCTGEAWLTACGSMQYDTVPQVAIRAQSGPPLPLASSLHPARLRRL